MWVYCILVLVLGVGDRVVSKVGRGSKLIIFWVFNENVILF